MWHAFSKQLRWLAQTKVISMKTHAENACRNTVQISGCVRCLSGRLFCCCENVLALKIVISESNQPYTQFLSGSISCRTYLYFRLVFQFTFMFWHDKLLTIDRTMIMKWKQVFAFLQQPSIYLLRNFICFVTVFEESCHVVENWKCDHHQNWKSAKKKLKLVCLH